TQPVFSTDGKSVYFGRNKNVYSIDLQSGLTVQLTDIREEDAMDEGPKKEARHKERLAAQQKQLLNSVRNQLLADSLAKAERDARKALLPKTFHVGKIREIVSIDISPNGQGALLLLRTPLTGEQ